VVGSKRRIPRGLSVGRSAAIGVLLQALLALVMASAPAAAQNPNLVYAFTGGPDGGAPVFLLPDLAGNLYGTTLTGGNLVVDSQGFEDSYGTVFKLAPNGNLATLHTFSGSDGWGPRALARDSAGNIYGVTGVGGDLGCGSPYTNGCGLVFKIDTHGNFSVLHTFEGIPDGWLPYSLVIDTAGNLYGTTAWGGIAGCGPGPGYGCGTVFKIDTHGTFTTLYTVTGGNDGAYIYSNLLLDATGNLYFATWSNGSGGDGALLKLSPSGSLTIFYSFDSTHGCCDTAWLALDPTGNIYGTTTYGGDQNNDGSVYKVTPSRAYSTVFTFNGTNGSRPTGPIALDANGNLYGTTPQGGSSLSNYGCGGIGCGAVFKVTPSGQETVLYNFSRAVDGYQPYGAVLDSAGHLYGMTWYGGGPFLSGVGPNYNGFNGMVFSLNP
jgi:uncharacterized repeat protein (TIGR03803 family)